MERIISASNTLCSSTFSCIESMRAKVGEAGAGELGESNEQLRIGNDLLLGSTFVRDGVVVFVAAMAESSCFCLCNCCCCRSRFCCCSSRVSLWSSSIWSCFVFYYWALIYLRIKFGPPPPSFFFRNHIYLLELLLISLFKAVIFIVYTRFRLLFVCSNNIKVNLGTYKKPLYLCHLLLGVQFRLRQFILEIFQSFL